MNDGLAAAGNSRVAHGTALGIELMSCTEYHAEADQLNECQSDPWCFELS
jgi:hypothetical protein